MADNRVDSVFKNNGWAQSIFTCYGDELMDSSNWKYDGYIGVTTDKQTVGSFDTTYFEYDEQSYYVTHKNSTIYITTVDPEDMLTPTGPLVLIGGCDRAFERNNATNQDIEEGSGVLIHDGKIFVTYSCCTVDMAYGVCLYYAELGDDLMDTDSWHKYQAPLLTTADLTTTVKEGVFTADNTEVGEYKGTFGPGHNNYTIDKNGNYVIVYHARDWEDSYPGATGDSKYGLSVWPDAGPQPVVTVTGVPMAAVATPTPSVVKQQPSATPKVKKGDIHSSGNNRYRIINVKKHYVEFIGLKNKKVKSATIPSYVKINKTKFKVTQIAAKSFLKCKKIKQCV